MSIVKLRGLILTALEGTPTVVAGLIAGRDDAEFDRRPDPDRFNVREAICHLADMDAVFLARTQRTVEIEMPELTPVDEEQMAIDNDYAHTDPYIATVRLGFARNAMLKFLRGLSDEQWRRAGRHPAWGDITVIDQVDLVLAHDGYHTRQVAEYLGVVRDQSTTAE